MEKLPDNRWKRRLAIQIASLLPEEPSDAREVLHYVHQLLDDFIVDGSESRNVIGFDEPASH